MGKYGEEIMYDYGKLDTLLAKYLPNGKDERDILKAAFSLGIHENLIGAMDEKESDFSQELSDCVSLLCGKFDYEKELVGDVLRTFAKSIKAFGSYRAYAASTLDVDISHNFEPLEPAPAPESDQERRLREIEEITDYQKRKEALPLLEALANEGYAPAQFAFGNRFYPKNEAYEWWSKAAEQGHANAQFELGKRCHYYSKKQPEDYKKAAEWYLKAAEQGHSEAQSKLGTLYEEGKGVPQDFNKAAEWYRKAAAQGDGYTMKKLYRLKKEGKV
jgi:TPR repeat protein